MGVSYDVVGIKPADEKYTQMKNIYELCERANVQVPKEVREFFRGTMPGARGY
jgi:phage terminase large subunit-like protein